MTNTSRYLIVVALTMFALPAVAARNAHEARAAHDACFFASASHEYTHRSAQTVAAAHHGHSRPSHSHPSTHTPFDQCAIHEMHDFAKHRLGAGHSRPETFGTAPRWSGDWHLRWIDYQLASGKVSRLYHLTNVLNPQRRYLSLVDHPHGHNAEWEPVH